MKSIHIICTLLILFFLSACHLPSQVDEVSAPPESPHIEDEQDQIVPSSTDKKTVEIVTEIGSGAIPPGTLAPGSLVYLGAFRLPDNSGGLGWDYSGHGMTYIPDGDPGGEIDGFPGSLFIVGHDHQLQVAEISIPIPVNSRNIADLNFAGTLQPFGDITGGMVNENMDIPRMGIEYLETPDGQSEAKLHFTFGQHFQEFEPSHGWASLDLSNPNPSGPWIFDGYTNYTTNDYLFAIPSDWGEANAVPYTLATGRFREGVWGGFGPALFAYTPFEGEDPPAPGKTITTIQPLLLYGTQVEGALGHSNDQCHAHGRLCRSRSLVGRRMADLSFRERSDFYRHKSPRGKLVWVRQRRGVGL